MGKPVEPPSFLSQSFLSDVDNIVVIDGETYDLTEFAHKHPGGPQFIIRSRARDITISVHSYHKDIRKIKAILKKYHVGTSNIKDLASDYVLPRFLLPKKFDAQKNLPAFDFDAEDDFQRAVIRAIDRNEPLKERLKYMDKVYNVITVLLFLAHIFVTAALATNMLNPWLCVPLLAILKTSLASSGHYGIHSKQPNWPSIFFNFSYVGSSLTAYDGHTLIHHSFTEQLPDVKRTFFSSLLNIPRLWRFPLHTLKLFALFLTGVNIRSAILTYDFLVVDRSWSTIYFNFQYYCARALLALEFLVCAYMGALVPWFAMFTLTLWFNMVLIVSSHDLVRDPEVLTEHKDDVNPKDYGLFQIQHANDTAVTGNVWVDCFLTAGLGCHRVHHLLPFQKTGFANIVCVPVVKKLAEERGVKWQPTKLLWVNQMPETLHFLATTPMRSPKKLSFWEENFSFRVFPIIFWTLALGLTGEGAI